VLTSRRVGSDQVIMRDGRAIVVTSVEMPDWEVRQHRIRPVQFDGRLWRVAEKTTAAGKVRYELAPWVPADEYVNGLEIHYDAAYVAARDRVAVAGGRSSHVTFLLRVVSPFVGLLPAATKGRLEERYGIDPVATTFHSVVLVLLIALTAFTLMGIGELIFGSTRFAAALQFGIGVLFALDGATRYSRILHEERPPPGFLEWLIRWHGNVPKIDR
jgi:hypothetical protein